MIAHFNLGNARILNSETGDDLMQTLGLTSHQYTIALMLFLVAYSVFETPSNLALKAFSPKRYTAISPLGNEDVLTFSIDGLGFSYFPSEPSALVSAPSRTSLVSARCVSFLGQRKQECSQG